MNRPVWSQRPDDPNSHEMLLWAMAEHQHHMMFAWLDRNPDKIADSLESAIVLAVNQEWTSALEALRLVRKLPIDVRMANGASLLHTAAVDKKYHSMDTLIRLGVNPDQQDWEGNTALHLALRHGAIRSATKLVKVTGHDLVNRWGELPLHAALKRNVAASTIKRMVARTSCWTQQETIEGDTVLMRAVYHYEHPEVLAPMMARGAAVALHIPNKRGETPHEWLQRRARHRRFANEGMAVYEQQVLRSTLDAAGDPHDATDDRPNAEPAGEAPAMRPRRRM